MSGAGDFLGPQFMGKLGDVTRSTHRNAMIAFADVDPASTSSCASAAGESGSISLNGKVHITNLNEGQISLPKKTDDVV